MSFADHFSGVAGAYAASRPTYPEALFAWLAAVAPRTALAWDAGCGSGQASTGLAAHFSDVRATDASASQLASAAPHSRVTYAVATERNAALADRSVDLVTVAQAVHWFDRPVFWDECRRVLVDGGVLAVWTYGVADITAEIDAIIDPFYRDVLGPYWPPERAHCDTHYRDIGFPFPRLDTPAFDMRLRWTRAQFMAYLGTWSAVQQFRAREGSDPLVPFDAELARAWPDGVAHEVRWPLTVLAGRVRH